MVGCDRSVHDNPPSIGSVITVKHTGSYTNGTLKHSFYWRQRPDIQWSNISQETRVTVKNFLFFWFVEID
jgi:hypothetical protein